MSTMDKNEYFGTVTKDSHFSKHSIMIIVGEPSFMRRVDQSLHEFFHVARRDKNFSNTFTFDLKSDTDIDFFHKSFRDFQVAQAQKILRRSCGQLQESIG